MNGFSTLAGMPPPVIFPPNLNIGDSWAFSMAAGDYSASAWSAVMTFASGATRLANTATLQEGIFYWLIPATDTSTLPAGTLAYTIAVSNSLTSERYTLQEGLVTALPDISDPNAPIATSTMLQQQLDACNKTILQLLSQRTSEVQFGGKSYTLWDIAKLWAVRNDLASRVSDEQAAAGGNSRGKLIIPVFKNPWGGPYPSAPWYPYGW